MNNIIFHKTFGPDLREVYHKRLRGYASIGYVIITQTEPTLFDELGDLNLTTIEGQIFNDMTFYRPFAKDLLSARHSVIISSPKLYMVHKSNVVSYLKDLSANGVEVAILTKEKNSQSEYLAMQGLNVHVIPNLSICCAIIDKSSVWYGSINILGYPSEEDNIIKVTDSNLANELINELYKCFP